jgi:hypothetical protein
MHTTHSFFELNLIGMAMSHQQNTFVPPTVDFRGFQTFKNMVYYVLI